MKKVLILLPDLSTRGGQKIALEVVKRLSGNEIEFQILCLGKNNNSVLDRDAEENGIDTVYLGKDKGFKPSVALKVSSAIKKYQPDVIHMHLPRMHYLLPYLLTTRFKPKTYYTVHNMADKDGGKLQHLANRIAFNYCGVIPVAISDICRNSLHEFYNYPYENIPCIYNGMDINKFRKPKEISKHNNFNKINFVTIGRMMRVKNHKFMIECFNVIHREFPGTRLTILGDGEMRQELKNQCIQLGIDAYVDMPGNVANVNEYLWNSDVFLMSSDYEGLPVAILEAMAAGLPIISTRVGGIADVVENNVNGILVDAKDKGNYVNAIRRIITDTKLLKEYGAASENMASKYSMSMCANGYKELYLQ